MFKVIPCTIDGKRPLIADWQRLASNDPAQLQAWKDTFGDKLTHWGIPTGSINDIVAVDIDVKSGGLESMKQLELPPTLSQRTLSGGIHFVYKHPGTHTPNRTKVLPGVDVRGDGGFIIHYGLDQTPIHSTLPAWVTTYKQPQAQGEPYQVTPGIALTELKESLERLRAASEGERNNTLNRESFRLAQLVATGALDQDIVFKALNEAAIEIGLTPHEVQATLKSAHHGGHTKPLTSPFGEPPPMPITLGVASPTPDVPAREPYTPSPLTLNELLDHTKLKRPQLHRDWSSLDLSLITADGGTGKTTLKLYEAVCLALGLPFLGFPCLRPGGRTLFITGEDSREKLAAMLGQILKEMNVLHDQEKLNQVTRSILIKKDAELTVITRDRDGFLRPSIDASEKLAEVCETFKPQVIVFDPIASFWGSESSVNDMGKAVSKFAASLVHKYNCQVELINHMGKESSATKDMSQFAARGGTGIPSHARIVKVMRPLSEEEYLEEVGEPIPENESAIKINVSKFSDGSPLLNKPFLVIRKGYLFERREIPSKEQVTELRKSSDIERIYSFIKEQRQLQNWPTDNLVISYFATHPDKLSTQRVKAALTILKSIGYEGVKTQYAPHPDLTTKEYGVTLVDIRSGEERIF